jgi:hypothetical protein
VPKPAPLAGKTAEPHDGDEDLAPSDDVISDESLLILRDYVRLLARVHGAHQDDASAVKGRSGLALRPN